MNTALTAGRFLVTLIPNGSHWEVRAFKKFFVLKKLISSDWFLDEFQARRYASELVDNLVAGTSTLAITNRKPGWTLHRPTR